ncbi:MAG: hypothetical protein JXR68_01395 [Bacteroidales bacterium]|nr:hypothetical protein [Bacteroidales bacterium]
MKKNINIEFSSIDYGWINFKIFDDTNEFKGFFLQYLDPLKDFIKWLEKVLTDKETYFLYNPEGDEISFSTDKKNIFRIKKSSNQQVLFEAEIERSQFVSNFYNTYINFFSSDLYQKNKFKWEGKTVAAYLAEHFELPLKQIDERLAASSKNELEKLKQKLNLDLPIPENWDNIHDEEKYILIKNYTGKIGAANPLTYKSNRIEMFLMYNF